MPIGTTILNMKVFLSG